MPPSAVKTIKQIIFYQYAKIISASSGMGKRNNPLRRASCEMIRGSLAFQGQSLNMGKMRVK
ncbi:MAG: hypothetical protein LBI19_00640 [Oscillospiraceae bacterium]|jgi:hypothetical protein|nr:hypothetical protein [Oscillospiraceae bacterium]